MNPLESVQLELVRTVAERSKLEQKINALQETIKLLEPIYGKQPTHGSIAALSVSVLGDIKELGITAAVERILMSNVGGWFAPPIIRDRLKEAGFELVGDNPLASIHQVLKRLVARENSCIVSEERNGQTLYRYDIRSGLLPYGTGKAEKSLQESLVEKVMDKYQPSKKK
jgi:hypothetical protein